MLCSACWIGRSECRASNSSMTLRKSGDRCWTTTNAIPGFGGRLVKNCSSDSSPPAEAPMPTICNLEGLSWVFIGDTDAGFTKPPLRHSARNGYELAKKFPICGAFNDHQVAKCNPENF